MNLKPIYQDIKDILGMDVYRIYKEEKHSIEETIIVGIITSVLFEFLKGFVDFEKLGDELKNEFKSVIEDFTPKKVKDTDEKANQKAKEVIDTILEDQAGKESLDIDQGYKNVVDALMALGLNQAKAERKAKAIVDKLKDNLES